VLATFHLTDLVQGEFVPDAIVLSLGGYSGDLWLEFAADALQYAGGTTATRMGIDNVRLTVCETPVATITGPASGSVYSVGTPVTFTGTFCGAGSSHTAQWTIGDNVVAGVVDENANTVTATVTFSSAGVYPMQLTVANDCGNSDSTDTVGDLPAMVVIYDPTAGFVTGGGWINSPAGAAAWDVGLTGKASFGFVSRYQKGATVPTGNTEFQFKAGALNFKSTSYEWLVVSGARAQYKGAGTINGMAGYGFILTAIDGQVSGGGGADKFRIKIWETATGTVVYDNQMAADDGADPTTVIGGGSIAIQN
jgi:PKD domain-containing protein